MFWLSASEVFGTPAEFGLRQLTYHDQKLAMLLFLFFFYLHIRSTVFLACDITLSLRNKSMYMGHYVIFSLKTILVFCCTNMR